MKIFKWLKKICRKQPVISGFILGFLGLTFLAREIDK